MRQGPETQVRRDAMDRMARAERDFDAIENHVINFLNELQGRNQSITGDLGVPTNRFSPLIERLENARRSRSFPSGAALYDFLFEEGIEPSALQAMAQKMRVTGVSGEFDPGFSHVQERFFGERLFRDLDFKSNVGGEAWLKEFVQEQMNRTNFNIETAHAIQQKARTVSRIPTYNTLGAAVTRLMYICAVDEKPHANGSWPPLLSHTKMDRLVSAREAEAQARGSIENEKQFFEIMRNFFSVYADITSIVLNRSTGEMHEKIKGNAKAALSRFLQSPEFQVATWEADQPYPDPFNVFQSYLLREDNPWVTEDCADTPFDESKFGRLISQDVPRGLVADSILFLNNYRATLLSEHTARLLQGVEKESEKGGEGSRPLSNRLQQRFNEVFAQAQALGLNLENTHDPEAQRHALSAFVAEHAVFPRAGNEGIHPFSVLLRMVDPRKIVTDEAHRQEFFTLLSQVPTRRDLERAPEGKEEDAFRNMMIVASSVKEFLRTPNSHLDIPLVGHELDFSTRMSLDTYARRRWFDDATLEYGPYVHLEARGPVLREPLIAPRDIESMASERIAQLRRNFNTAAGVDTHSKRDWIAEATAVWNDLPNSYNNILNFARRQSEKFYGTGNEYGLTFYPSATAAMNDVVNRLFEPIEGKVLDEKNEIMKSADYVMISHQEYGGMIDAFTNHGAEVLAIHTNDRAQRRALSGRSVAESMIREIESRVGETKDNQEIKKKLPRAIVLSSKTRFGDAIGLSEGQGDPNAYGLGVLVTLLKQRYPTIPIILDGAQSVGRNDRGENDLARLRCDVYVNSGAKGLGIENVAMLALKRANGTNHWLSHIKDADVLRNPLTRLSPGKSTVDVRRIAALGIALQMQNQRSDTWRQMQHNDVRSQRERVAEHMQTLTRYAIEKAALYGDSLLERADFPFHVAPEEKSDAEALRQLGCHVVYPVHRKMADFNGIVTLTFPNIRSVRVQENRQAGTRQEIVERNYLKTALQREGFAVEQCLPGQNGLRISFHYLHEEQDIDELFVAIEKVHLSLLRREIDRNNIQNFAQLRAQTSNRPDDWIED